MCSDNYLDLFFNLLAGYSLSVSMYIYPLACIYLYFNYQVMRSKSCSDALLNICCIPNM